MHRAGHHRHLFFERELFEQRFDAFHSIPPGALSAFLPKPEGAIYSISGDPENPAIAQAVNG